MSDVPPLIPGSKLFNTLKVINGTNISKATINSLIELNEWKGLVDLATITNIAFLSGNKVVDGVTATQGYIVLVKDQNNASQNGIYTVNTTGVWTRSNLLKTGSNAAGIAVFVKLGLVNLNKVFVCTNEPLSATVGTNDLVFESVVLNINDLTGTDGGIVYKDGSNFGVDTGTTDGAGNLILTSLNSNGTVLSGSDLVSDEYSFISIGKRIYYDTSLIKFDNGGSQVLELGSTFASTVPIVSNEYSFSGDTSVSIGYTSGQVSVNIGSNEIADIRSVGFNTDVEYYSGSSNSLSYQYSGTSSGIQNTGSNDIDFIINGTSVMKVGPSAITNTLDVVSPNFLFDDDGSGILFNGSDIDFDINGSNILSLNSTKTLSNVPITSSKYQFNDSDTKNVKFANDVMTFKTNSVDILTVSSLAVSTSTSLLSNSYILGPVGIVNSSNNITVYNTDTSITVSSTALTTNKRIIANKYAFLNNENNYLGFTSNSIAFNLATTTSISLSQSAFNTNVPLTINNNYLSSPALGTTNTYNVSTANNSLVLGGGLYTLKGSVNNFATAAWLQLSLQTGYLVSGRVSTNAPIIFKIQKNTSTVITNIQGTYSTYFTLTGSNLYFNSDYSSYSFSILVNKSVA